MRVVILKPRGVFLTSDVDSVTAPGKAGELTILPSHTAITTSLASGIIAIAKDATKQSFKIPGGFMNTKDDNVVILVHDIERLHPEGP